MTSDVMIDKTAFVHKSSKIYGKVRIGNKSSIWPNVVIRSEMHEVVIGCHTNIQDFCMIHVGADTGTYIGDYCSITHHCTMHGCIVEDNCLIGINSTIMDGARIGKNSIVAGGSFVKEGMEVPENSIVMGVPAIIKKNKNNFIQNRFNAFMYQINGQAYARGEHRAWAGKDFEEIANRKMLEIIKEYESTNKN